MSDRESRFTLVDISKSLPQHRAAVEHFVACLGPEKAQFDLTLPRVDESMMVVVAYIDDQIVGLCGVEGHRLFPKGYIIVSRSHQGQGLAKTLLEYRHKIASEIFDTMIYVIHEDNTQSHRVHRSFGARYIGRRWQLHYYGTPYNLKGKFWQSLIKLAFPVVRIADSLTRPTNRNRK